MKVVFEIEGQAPERRVRESGGEIVLEADLILLGNRAQGLGR
jgi:hypothetical protein